MRDSATDFVGSDFEASSSILSVTILIHKTTGVTTLIKYKYSHVIMVA